MPLLQVLLSLTTFVTNYATIANKKTALEEIQANDTNKDLEDIFTKLFSIIAGENTYTLDEVKSDTNTKFNNEVTSLAGEKEASEPYVEGVVPATPGFENISVWDGPVTKAIVYFGDLNGAGSFQITDSTGVASVSTDATYVTSLVNNTSLSVVPDENSIDTLTGHVSLSLVAPLGSETINPLTTMTGLNGSNPSGNKVQIVLGVPASINMPTFNPYLPRDPSIDALAGAIAASQVVSLASAASNDTDAQTAVLSATSKAINEVVDNATLDLTDQVTIKKIYDAANVNLADDKKITEIDAKATNTSKINIIIRDASSIGDVGIDQGQGLNMIAKDLPADTPPDSNDAINTATSEAADGSAAGSSEGQTSGTSGDLIDPVLTTISMTSNNEKDNKLAKEGNIVTLTMVANENIQKPVVTFTIENTTITPKVQGINKNWTATYTVEAGLNDTVNFKIEYQDIAGNNGIPRSNVTQGSKVTVDTTAPVITVTGDNPEKVEKGSTYTDAGATTTEGTVTSSSTVDTSTIGTYIVTYSATDAAGNTGTATRTVNVVDTKAPTINVANVKTFINDGTKDLGSVSANEEVDWSIEGTDASLVKVDSTGNLSLTEAADSNVKTSYSYVIVATDKSENKAESDVITVQVVDDSAPTLKPVSIESNNSNTNIATNDDTITLKMVANENIQKPVVTFTIGGVNKTPNVQRKVPETDNNWTATYKVEAGLNGVVQFTINFTDTNSNPGATVTTTTDDSSVTVDTVPVLDVSKVKTTINDGTKDLGSVSADQDVEWSIEGTDANLVEVDGTGKLSLTEAADYETDSSYSYVIVATDNAGNKGKATISVSVNDTTAPVLDVTNVKRIINDGTTVLGSVSANEDVYWDVENVDPINVDVKINKDSGKLFLETAIDYYTTTSFSYDIVATDTDNSDNSANITTQTISVDVQFIDEVELENEIYDGQTELGTIALVDKRKNVSWSIDDSETYPSNIDVNVDGSSGVITLFEPIDYDTNTSFKYVVTSTDQDDSSNIVNTTVNVTVRDLINIEDILTVKEGEQTIGTVTTYNDTINVTWTIEGTDANLVSVDSSSGVITLDSSANIETDSSYSFVVVATYVDNTANVARKDLTVTVIDTEPIINTSNVVTTIYDGETELGTANADRAVSWSIDDSETNPSNIDVNIDGSSGVITLSEPIDYDTNTSFKYVVTATEADNSGDVVNTTVNVTVKDLINTEKLLTRIKEGEQTIGTVETYNDEIDVTWTIEGTDASLVSVDGSGVITLDSSANIDTDYSFVVVATYVDNTANVAKKDLAVTVTE